MTQAHNKSFFESSLFISQKKPIILLNVKARSWQVL